MNKYRTHTCGELTKLDKEKEISLSGWINKKRDHGNLLFVDLRDTYGITQCVIDNKNNLFKKIEKIPLETVVQFEGRVVRSCLLYTSPSPRDNGRSRMPSSA